MCIIFRFISDYYSASALGKRLQQARCTSGYAHEAKLRFFCVGVLLT